MKNTKIASAYTPAVHISLVVLIRLNKKTGGRIGAKVCVALPFESMGVKWMFMVTFTDAGSKLDIRNRPTLNAHASGRSILKASSMFGSVPKDAHGGSRFSRVLPIVLMREKRRKLSESVPFTDE